MGLRTLKARYKQKAGKHGSLFYYCIIYTDRSDPGIGKMRWHTWAYSQEHAVEKFYDSEEEGWTALKIARVHEDHGQHRWTWHSLRDYRG